MKLRDDLDADGVEVVTAVPHCFREAAAVWRESVGRLPPYVKLATITGLEPDRSTGILGETCVPRRSEALALDAALGTDALALLPVVSSASVPQIVAPARIRFVAPSPPQSQVSTDSADLTGAPAATGRKGRPLSSAPLASTAAGRRAEVWRERHERSAKTIGSISRESGVGYKRTVAVLRRGVRPTPDEVSRLERVLGSA